MIGIDISDQTIKIVQISASSKRKMLAHCITLLPPHIMVNGIVEDKKQMAEHLKKALSSCRIPQKIRDSVVASIPETQSFLRIVEIPTMAEDEVHEAVRWEIAQHIPFGLESVYIDWQFASVPEQSLAPNRMEVQVGAAQKKVVDPLYEVIDSLGLDIAAFELESQAIVRSLISHEWQLKQGIIIVDLGSTATNVVVYDHGAIRFTASLQRGVAQLITSLAPNDAKAVMDNLQALPDELMNRVQESILLSADLLVQDVLGVVKFYNGIKAKHEVKEIILTGGGSNLPGLDTVFLKYFTDVHVQRGNPWVNILRGKNATKPPMDIQESVRYATAIGLALRNVIAV